MDQDVSPRLHRFSLLARLSLAVADEGYWCSLTVPPHGEAVLCVPYPHQPGHHLAIGAVELNGHWVYTFNGRWNPADNLTETTAQVLTTVGA